MGMYICLIFSFYMMFFSFMVFLFGFILVNLDFSVFLEWEVVALNSMNVEMFLILDWISMMFMGLVLFISSVVVWYSLSYMGGDMNLDRFIILVVLFVVSMMFLIISPNLISILLGWDGLGLVSFCLVIYYQNSKSFNSGMLTVLSNRVGDVMILMSICWMVNYGGWNLLLSMKLFKNDLEMTVIILMLILAAITKSAQIPFSSWLPAAMAAPTPVSALVHSSTLVTAGVYLMIRFSELMGGTILMDFLLILSSATMFMAGVVANFEYDLKKIIALSTLSQLGLMLSILSMGFCDLAFFHLLTHAMFKSMLFMSAGLIIHSMKNTQDIRFMGNISKFMPLVSISLNVGNLSLCGFPFLAGFYSKDLILEKCLISNLNCFFFFFFFFSTGLTVSYSVRLTFFSMLGSMNFSSLFVFFDEDYKMIFSIKLMLMLSILGGSVLMWLIMDDINFIYLEGVNQWAIIFVLFIGVIMGFVVYKSSHFLMGKGVKMIYFISLMWFMPSISTSGVNWLVLKSSLSLKKINDLGWFEYLGGQGLMNLMESVGMELSLSKVNFVKKYLVSMVFMFFCICFFI
uniref:NADH dehydrogenase subunit 5 n=1 Tax=Gunungiella acanthoclada TaxID=3025504 RepID=UPI002435CAD0|nr:NADH dehydrogenase subunit 5 [Gunungiella acanthoclada]WEU80057.1 NADH dehydrogenase subunit 5 [Gunungiella acanthoclada]